MSVRGPVTRLCPFKEHTRDTPFAVGSLLTVRRMFFQHLECSPSPQNLLPAPPSRSDSGLLTLCPLGLLPIQGLNGFSFCFQASLDASLLFCRPCPFRPPLSPQRSLSSDLSGLAAELLLKSVVSVARPPACTVPAGPIPQNIKHYQEKSLTLRIDKGGPRGTKQRPFILNLLQ